MSKSLDPERPGRFSSSLVAGLSILRCFTAEHAVRGIAEMADELDLARSTTHRYATTLVTLGYLEQGPSRKYRLSSRVADVGLSRLGSMAIRSAGREPLRELRAQSGRTASLAVLWGTEIVYVDFWQGSRQGQYAVNVGIGLGTCLPVHCSDAGKALLAHLPMMEQQGLTERLHLTRHAPKTIASKTALSGELKRIAANGGVAVEDEELSAGRRAIAAVVLDTEGQQVAVELAVPSAAYTRREMLDKLGPKVAMTGHIVSILNETSAAS
jgi:DNA-binding IclR family transcriptional regulator